VGASGAERLDGGRSGVGCRFDGETGLVDGLRAEIGGSGSGEEEDVEGQTGGLSEAGALGGVSGV
jgi:hypothetical protein